MISIFIIFASVAGVLQQVIVVVLGRDSWPLYSFGSTFFGFPDEGSMFASGNIMRTRSFYSEPGYMGVHLSMLFSILLFTKKNLSKWIHFFYLIGVGSTISMSALAITVLIYAIYFFEIKKVKKIFKALVGLAVIVEGFVFVYINVPYFPSRIVLFSHLQDSSAVVRTIGSVHFLTECPWYGVGAGNNANYYFSLNLGNSIWYAGGGEFYNVLVVASITMGYVGLFGLLILEFSFVGKNWKLFLAFIITQCGWGLLYTTPIWVFMIMAYVVTNEDYVQEKERAVSRIVIKMPLRIRLRTKKRKV